MHNLVSRLKSLLIRRRLEAELAEELQTHVELEARKYVAAGVPPDEARRRAIVALGSRVTVVEQCRDQRGFLFLENAARDCRDAFRTIRRSPSFALTVVLTMAVAIGANTTVFSFCRAILLATLPVPNPQDLHLVSIEYPGSPGFPYFSFPDVEKMRNAAGANARLSAFSEVVEYHAGDEDGTTSTIQGQLVAGDFFSTLQVQPLAGRPFTPADNAPGAAPVAALHYRYWQDRFDGDPSVVGRELRIQRAPVQIVAVMPEGFDGLDPGARPDLWMPLAVQGQTGYQGFSMASNRDWRRPWILQEVSWVRILGRSPADPNGERLRARLTRYIASVVAEQLPNVSDPRQREQMLGARVRVDSAAGGLPGLRETFSLPLKILFGLVAVLLFSACINLTNLLLARARAHQHENALRLSLGAGRSRLVTRQLTEILILTGLGGLVSIPLAWASARMILPWLGVGQELSIDLTPGWMVLGFAAGVTVLCAALMALAPAWQMRDRGVSRSLGQRWQTAAGARRHRRSLSAVVLTAGQVAFSVVALVVAGLLTHTLMNYARMDAGLARNRVLSVRIDPLAAGYANPIRSAELYRRLVAQINRIPGVISSSVAGCGLLGGACATLIASADGQPELRPPESVIERNYVGPQYFSTVGMELIRGREIDAADRFNAPPVAVVNRTFEARFLNGVSAIDRTVSTGGQKLRVIGVVKDALTQDLHRPAMPSVYLAVHQVPGGWSISAVEVRTAGDPAAMAQAVRTAILQVDRAIPIAEMIPLADKGDRRLAREILTGRLAGVFSLLTLLTAALGLFGVLAYEVSQRRGEIAVRMALGATRGSVAGMVFSRASRVWVAGCALGLLASVFTARLTTSLLFGTGQFDAWTYGASLAILLAVSTAAVLAPALRASAVDPAEALRGE